MSISENLTIDGLSTHLAYYNIILYIKQVLELYLFNLINTVLSQC